MPAELRVLAEGYLLRHGALLSSSIRSSPEIAEARRLSTQQTGVSTAAPVFPGSSLLGKLLEILQGAR